MKKYFMLLGVMAAFILCAFNDVSAKRIFTAKDLMTMKRVASPKISPDGKWVLYNMGTPALQDNKIYKDLFVVSIDGKETKQLTNDQAADFNALWSPNGKQIAFLSTRDGAPQIYVMDFPNGKMSKITDLKAGVSNMAWSPTGTHFSFTSEVKINKTTQDLYPAYKKAKVRIYDKLPVRHWSEWIDQNFSHLFVVSSQGGYPTDLMKGQAFDTPLKPFGGGEEIGWSPDGKEIAYTCKVVPNFAESTDSDIFLISINGGSAKNITKGMVGFDKSPLYSPDGKWIAFASQERASFESDRIRLMLFNRESGKITELSKTVDQWVQEANWAPDSKSLYFMAGTKGADQIYNITLDGKWNILTKGWYNHGHGLDISNDGKTIVMGRQSMTEPMNFFSMSAKGGTPKQITTVNSKHLAELEECKVEERWFTSTDGKKVHSWIVFPPNFNQNKKYPMITYLQGGPQAMIGQRFHFRWNWYMMASQGYVVVAANRRGVPGFGQEWNDAISKDWGGMPMQDYLAVTDAMAQEKYIDKDGLAAIGASAGGYAAFWMAGNHKGRFSALMAHCGVFNMESMYGSTEELWFPNWENGGPYWDSKNKAYYDKHSPHRFAQNWDTPIIISTGEYDFRVPYTQSLEAFTVAQVKGIPSKLLVYPDETHFIAKPQEYIIWANEVFDFLGKYCK